MRRSVTLTSGQLACKPMCPGCGAINDGFTTIEEGAPRPGPGDISLCGYCGKWLIFDRPAGRQDDTADCPLILRRPSDHEMATIIAMPDYAVYQRMRDEFIAKRAARRLN